MKIEENRNVLVYGFHLFGLWSLTREILLNTPWCLKHTIEHATCLKYYLVINCRIMWVTGFCVNELCFEIITWNGVFYGIREVSNAVGIKCRYINTQTARKLRSLSTNGSTLQFFVSRQITFRGCAIWPIFIMSVLLEIR